jgi:FtsZ-binding cell division protein ZapB
MVGMGYMGYLEFQEDVVEVAERQEEISEEVDNLQLRAQKIDYLKTRLKNIQENQETIRALLVKYAKSNGD